MKLYVLALVSMMLLAAALASQTTTPPRKPQIGSGAWWRNPEFANQLHLTQAQIKDFGQSFTQHYLKIADANADTQKESVRVDSLLQTDAPEQELLAEINKLADARCRVLREQILTFCDARHILTPEQWHKFQGLRAASAYENTPAPAAGPTTTPSQQPPQ